MSKPSIAELSKNNKYNRYTLVMAAAKGARYVIAKENYEKEHRCHSKREKISPLHNHSGRAEPEHRMDQDLCSGHGSHQYALQRRNAHQDGR